MRSSGVARSTGVRHALPLVVLALFTLLGIYDQQYTAEAAPTQVIRLFGVAVGGGLAVVASTLRLRGEERLRRVSDAIERSGGGEPGRRRGRRDLAAQPAG
jgi:hypothetical protein